MFSQLNFKRMCVSMLEILLEAFGTTLVMIVLSFISASGAKSDLRTGEIFGVTAGVLIYFALTGYVVTVALVGTFLRGKGRWVNPVASALLYLFHSTIFFVLAGNRIGDWGRSNLAIQVCGALVALGCGYLGNRLVILWAGRL